MHLIKFYCLLLGMCTISISTAQKVLQLETRGKIKTQKFYLGDELSVQLTNEKFWRHTTLINVDLDDLQIEFDFGAATINEIKAIKTPQQRYRGKNWRNKLLISSAGFILYAPLELIYQDDPNWNLIAGGIGLGVLGLILKPVMDVFSKHNIGGRKRLRLLDLTYVAPQNQP